MQANIPPIDWRMFACNDALFIYYVGNIVCGKWSNIISKKLPIFSHLGMILYQFPLINNDLQPIINSLTFLSHSMAILVRFKFFISKVSVINTRFFNAFSLRGRYSLTIYLSKTLLSKG